MLYNAKIEKYLYKEKDLKKLFSQGDIEKCTAISFVNPYSYGLIKTSNVDESIDMWFSDGALLCKLTNLYRKEKIDRVSFDFSSIAGYVFEQACLYDYKVAIIGGNDQDISAATDYILKKYPALKLCYTRNGYFAASELSNVVSEVDASAPDIVIAGLGTPLQEKFIVAVKESSSNKRLLFTCGGFISQTSDLGDYYHPIVKKLGLRWLQRAYLHSYVRDRLFKVYPRFVCLYIKDILSIKLKS